MFAWLKHCLRDLGQEDRLMKMLDDVCGQLHCVRKVGRAHVMWKEEEDPAEARRIREGFLYAPDHALWGAVMRELALFRESCVQTAKDPALTETERHMALGGVATLDDFKADLEAQAKKSKKAE